MSFNRTNDSPERERERESTVQSPFLSNCLMTPLNMHRRRRPAANDYLHFAAAAAVIHYHNQMHRGRDNEEEEDDDGVMSVSASSLAGWMDGWIDVFVRGAQHSDFSGGLGRGCHRIRVRSDDYNNNNVWNTTTPQRTEEEEEEEEQQQQQSNRRRIESRNNARGAFNLAATQISSWPGRSNCRYLSRLPANTSERPDYSFGRKHSAQ